MVPRLKTSKKWSLFPKELTLQIESVIRENFAAKLAEKKLVIEGRIYPEEILLRIGLVPSDSIRQINFEVSIGYDQAKGKVMETIHLSLDAAGAMLDEYLNEDEAARFPKIWTEQLFQKQKIFIQSSSVNSDLESEADRLLGESAAGLYNEVATEDDEDEEAGTGMPEDPKAIAPAKAPGKVRKPKGPIH